MRAPICAFLLLAPAIALAGPREEVHGAAARCDSIPDDRAWLDCYYGAAQPMRSRLGLVPAPAGQQRLVPLPPLGVLPGAGHIQSRMASYAFDSSGAFTVTLANGDVWRQGFGDPRIVRWKNPANAYLVSIAPDGAGGYDMQVEGDKRIFKVRRALK